MFMNNFDREITFKYKYSNTKYIQFVNKLLNIDFTLGHFFNGYAAS